MPSWPRADRDAPRRSDHPAAALSPYSKDSQRVAVISYVPFKPNRYYVLQFTTMIYASWKYVISHPTMAWNSQIPGWSPLRDLVVPDMLVFCSPEACSELPADCHVFDPSTFFKQDHWSREGAVRLPACYQFSIPEHPNAAAHGWVNALVFGQHPQIDSILLNYDWTIRLDTDCMLTPAFLAWIPKPGREIAMEQAHYCTEFNKERLESIAKKLNVTNQKIHCIGSSFYIRPKLMLKFAPLAINLTMHIALFEFDPKLPGLEKIFKDNTSNPDGEWPTWWRGVSSMYGSELALNAVVPNLVNGWVTALLDQGTCGTGSVMRFVQLHCYHSDCQFRKFDFMDSIIHQRDSRSLDPRLFIYYDDRDASEMSSRDYTQFIAWHGAAHYVQHLKVWTAHALGVLPPNA